MLTPAKVKYLIRAKTNNISSKIIAAEMKVSVRTVNRIWSYWMKNKKPWGPKKFGRPKTTLSKSNSHLVLETYKEQNSGARRLEKIKLRAATPLKDGVCFGPRARVTFPTDRKNLPLDHKLPPQYRFFNSGCCLNIL